jgi:aspartyl-tRNA(Asn)/glutamyl-tRNA(Gln) amidotransferase subunit B
METLRTKIESDIKTSMINKDVERRETLKFLKSEIMRSEKDSNTVLDNEGVIKIIRKTIKNLETISREKEKKEIQILFEYLPKTPGKEEIEKWTREAITKYPEKYAEYKSGKTGMIGLFMGEVMKLSKGTANPKEANEIIKSVLDN